MKKLRTDVYAAAGTLLDFIETLPKRPVLLAIDGRCGAGKSTLARALGEKAGAAVVHMDDFFLRPEQRTPERFAEPGGNVDRERVLEEVLAPLRENRPAVYRPYDAHKPAMLEPVHLEPSPVTIIEGSYSCHPALWNYYDARGAGGAAPAHRGPQRLRETGGLQVQVDPPGGGVFSRLFVGDKL